MRCLYVASEVAGFAKTGGLADVAASLPRALAERGHDCAVIMPLYHCVRVGPHKLTPTGLTFSVPMGKRLIRGSLWKTILPGSTVPIYLVEHAGYFERDLPGSGRGLYQVTRPDGTRGDYDDNCERFVFFGQACLEAIRLLDFWPDVVHLNDWQTGLIPVYLKELYPSYPEVALRPRFAALRTLLTIHNLAYQGLFWHLDMPLTGLPWRLFNYEKLEFFGKLSFLKAGVVYADLLSTVSPTYAKEIQTPYYGCGLQSVLTGRQRDLFGIVNGIRSPPGGKLHRPYRNEGQGQMQKGPAAALWAARKCHHAAGGDDLAAGRAEGRGSAGPHRPGAPAEGRATGRPGRGAAGVPYDADGLADAVPQSGRVDTWA
jgi:starch synthase